MLILLLLLSCLVTSETRHHCYLHITYRSNIERKARVPLIPENISVSDLAPDVIVPITLVILPQIVRSRYWSVVNGLREIDFWGKKTDSAWIVVRAVETIPIAGVLVRVTFSELGSVRKSHVIGRAVPGILNKQSNIKYIFDYLTDLGVHVSSLRILRALLGSENPNLILFKLSLKSKVVMDSLLLNCFQLTRHCLRLGFGGFSLGRQMAFLFVNYLKLIEHRIDYVIRPLKVALHSIPLADIDVSLNSDSEQDKEIQRTFSEELYSIRVLSHAVMSYNAQQDETSNKNSHSDDPDGLRHGLGDGFVLMATVSIFICAGIGWLLILWHANNLSQRRANCNTKSLDRE